MEGMKQREDGNKVEDMGTDGKGAAVLRRESVQVFRCGSPILRQGGLHGCVQGNCKESTCVGCQWFDEGLLYSWENILSASRGGPMRAEQVNFLKSICLGMSHPV